MKLTRSIHFRITERDYNRLKARAFSDDRSLGYIVRKIIRKAVESDKKINKIVDYYVPKEEK